jgi:hypothetical protein
MVRRSVAAAAVLLALAPMATAAESYVGGTTPAVKGTEVSRPAPPAVLAQQADPDPDDRIPITGGDVAGLAAIGMGSLAVGLALTRRARRPA